MSLTTERLSPTSLKITRRFAAPRDLVWRAHTDPDLIRKWLLGPDGWTMTICKVDFRPGGHMHYRWEEVAGDAGFDLKAEVLEAAEPELIRHVEVMHLPDPTPPNRVETRFAPDGDGTLLTMTMQVDSAETMEAMIASGMTDGMEQSYQRLDGLTGAR